MGHTADGATTSNIVTELVTGAIVMGPTADGATTSNIVSRGLRLHAAWLVSMVLLSMNRFDKTSGV